VPKYTYSCSQCGHTFDSLETISNRNQDIPCPLCGEPSPRNVGAELSDCSDFSATCGDHVRYSRSLGCVPKQLEEARRLHPGAEFVRLPGDKMYRMVIHNRNEKLQRMKERGMEEQDRVRGDWSPVGDS
jgi:putative FmdB family regulatory protein